MTGLALNKYLAVSIVSLLTLVSAAQDPGTGAIKGHVYDPAGLPVSGSHVLIVNESTHAKRSADTSTEGLFTVPLLSPGSYTVIVRQPGFEERESHAVVVSVGDTSSLIVRLSIAKMGTSVQVNAETELLQTQSATLGRTVDDTAMQALPLSTRNFTQILSLSPGVVVSIPNATSLGAGTQNVTDAGNKTTANNIQFNGVDANNLSQNSAKNDVEEVGVAIPAPDTIQEFKVQTASYDASYGRGTGANVDLVSKAGTNAFHGSVWEFLRNDIFNANLFFSKLVGQPRAVLKQNQFGASFGGPIFRNKLFFFGAYQGLRSSNGLGDTVTTFLPALTADRSAATLGATFCSSGPTFAGGTQLACNGSNINPVALKLLNLKFANGNFAVPTPQLLLPRVAGQTPEGESTFSIPAHYKEDQYTVNLDETLSSKDQASARFFYANSPTLTPFTANAANVPGWGTDQLQQNVMLVLGETHVFSASTVNLARVGYMRFSGYLGVTDPVAASDIGTESPTGASGPNVPMPGIGIDGLFTVGDGGTPFQAQTTNSFIAQETLARTQGRVSLSAGIEGKHHEVEVNPPFLATGFFQAHTFNDFLIGQSATQVGSTSGIGNIELSGANSGIFRRDERYNDFALFVQSDIRLSPRASIFTGLRYEIFGSPVEAKGRLASFDPSAASFSAPAGGTLSGFVVTNNFAGAVPNGVQQLNRKGLWANHFLDLSPRIGFAVQVMDKPVVLLRGGFGIYYDRISAGIIENLVNQPPFAETQVLFDAQTGSSTEQHPFVPLLPAVNNYPLFLPRTPGGAQTLYPVDPHIVDPYTEEYNLNLQTALAHDFLVEVGYVGNRGLHIPGGTEFNQALLASPQHPINGETTNTTNNITNRLPYAGVATASILFGTKFASNYNSLQASVTKRLSHGLQFLGSYTWSRNLDETSGTQGSDALEEWLLSNDQNNPRQAYGPTDFDRANRGVISLVYQSPSFESAPGIARNALHHWQLSAIAVAQSGSPITVLDSNAGLVYGNQENRAAAPITNPMTSGSMLDRVRGHYLNAASFPSAPIAPNGVSPSDTDFGNSGTGFLRGPAQRNLDVALERSFPIVRSTSFNFRTEFFNLTNTTSFGNPSNNLASGESFGTITGAAGNPRIIQFAAKILF